MVSLFDNVVFVKFICRPMLAFVWFVTFSPSLVPKLKKNKKQKAQGQTQIIQLDLPILDVQVGAIADGNSAVRRAGRTMLIHMPQVGVGPYYYYFIMIIIIILGDYLLLLYNYFLLLTEENNLLYY